MKTFLCLVYCAAAALWMLNPAAQAQVKIGPPPTLAERGIGIPVQNYAVLDLSALAPTDSSAGLPLAWAVALQENGKVSFVHEIDIDDTLASNVRNEYRFEQGNVTLLQRVPVLQTTPTPDGPMPLWLGGAAGSFLTPGGRLFMNDNAYLHFEMPSGDPACPLIVHEYGWNTTAEIQGGVPGTIFPPAPHDCGPGGSSHCNYVNLYRFPWMVVKGANDSGYICGQGTGFCYGKTNPDGTTTIAGASDYAGLLYGPNKTIIFDRNGSSFPSGSPSVQIVGEAFVPQSVNRNGWAINGIILWSGTPENGYLFWSDHPQAWNGTSLIDIGPGFYNPGRLYALNEQNQIIGDDYADQWGGEGFLWENGGLTYFRDQLPKNLQGQINHITPIALSSQRAPAPAVPLAPDPSLCVLTGSTNWGFPYLMWKRDNAGAWSVAAIRLPEEATINWVGLLPSMYAQVNSSGIIAATGSTGSSPGDLHALLLIPVDLAVDADRNGIVEFDKDYTSPQKPFRFWCNDDYDFGDSDHPGALLKDSSFDISSLRDLEDYSRLHIHLGSLQDAVADGTIQVGLEWRNVESVNGSLPSIKIFQAAEPDGGMDYIKDADGSGNWPASQCSGTCATALGTINSSSGFKFPASFWKQSPYGLPVLSAGHPNRYLIFDGVTEGKGRLVLTFWKGATKIGEGGDCWLDIKNIKKMYRRGKAQPENIVAPNGNVVGPFTGLTSWVEDPNGQPFPTEKPKDENDKAIIFVHGWSMDYPNYISFSETMFKRLWQMGFKGRFCTLRWDPLVVAQVGLINVSAGEYNRSEHRAWLYGSSLKQFAETIKNEGFTVSLIGHSMGNVVTGSALQKGLSVENLLLMEAAIPAGCYDTSNGINSYGRFTDAEASEPTPDYHNVTKGYRGFLSSISGNVAAKIVNYHNRLDYALATGHYFGKEANWERNQIDYKPDGLFFPATDWHYHYDPHESDLNRRATQDFSLFVSRFVTDSYEMKSFVARPRSKAAGAVEGALGDPNIDGMEDVNLRTMYGFGADPNDHSGQFNRRIQQVDDLYKNVLNFVQPQTVQ